MCSTQSLKGVVDNTLQYWFPNKYKRHNDIPDYDFTVCGLTIKVVSRHDLLWFPLEKSLSTFTSTFNHKPLSRLRITDLESMIQEFKKVCLKPPNRLDVSILTQWNEFTKQRHICINTGISFKIKNGKPIPTNKTSKIWLDHENK